MIASTVNKIFKYVAKEVYYSTVLSSLLCTSYCFRDTPYTPASTNFQLLHPLSIQPENKNLLKYAPRYRRISCIQIML